MESLGDYCVVCGQLIHAGEISVTLVYQKAHQRCSENRYTTPLGLPRIKLVSKKTKKR